MSDLPANGNGRRPSGGGRSRAPRSQAGKPIVVVGSVNLDLVCVGKRIPAPGETLTGKSFQTFFGGKGANQAVGAARLGYPVAMVAKVGSDEFGKRLRQGLEEAGVETRAVMAARDVSSGVALISVDAQGQNSIMVIPGANGELRPRDLDKFLPLLRSAGIILAQLEIPLETVEYLSSLAQRFQVPFMLDPAPAPGRGLPPRLLRNVTYLTPNETEACALLGMGADGLSPATAPEFARKLQESGASHVVLKMGHRGAYVLGPDGSGKRIAPYPVKAKDSTAAGDAFNAAMAVALMQGRELDEAVRFAAAAGAISTTRAGAQASMPSAREVERLAASRNGHSGRRGQGSKKAQRIHSGATR